MSTVTKEQMAALLNGREYGDEISREESAQARASGLVVVFGYSDDNMELKGAINDEVGCNDGGTIRLGPDGILPDWKDIDHDEEEEAEGYFKKKAQAKNQLTAIWCPKDLKCSWAYKLDAPHATFDIMEDGELYCRGIVFAIADLTGGVK